MDNHTRLAFSADAKVTQISEKIDSAEPGDWYTHHGERWTSPVNDNLKLRPFWKWDESRDKFTLDIRPLMEDSPEDWENIAALTLSYKKRNGLDPVMTGFEVSKFHHGKKLAPPGGQGTVYRNRYLFDAEGNRKGMGLSVYRTMAGYGNYSGRNWNCLRMIEIWQDGNADLVEDLGHLNGYPERVLYRKKYRSPDGRSSSESLHAVHYPIHPATISIRDLLDYARRNPEGIFLDQIPREERPALRRHITEQMRKNMRSSDRVVSAFRQVALDIG